MGPVDLRRGEFVDLAVAFAVADDRTSLEQALESSRVSWASLREGRDGTPPRAVELLSCVPNPFNPTTAVRFAVPRDTRLRLDVLDVRGRLVRRLLDGPVAAGFHRQVWDGRDANGRGVASGVYHLRLRADGEERSRKITLVR